MRCFQKSNSPSKDEALSEETWNGAPQALQRNPERKFSDIPSKRSVAERNFHRLTSAGLEGTAFPWTPLGLLNKGRQTRDFKVTLHIGDFASALC